MSVLLGYLDMLCTLRLHLFVFRCRFAGYDKTIATGDDVRTRYCSSIQSRVSFCVCACVRACVRVFAVPLQSCCLFYICHSSHGFPPDFVCVLLSEAYDMYQRPDSEHLSLGNAFIDSYALLFVTLFVWSPFSTKVKMSEALSPASSLEALMHHTWLLFVGWRKKER